MADSTQGSINVGGQDYTVSYDGDTITLRSAGDDDLSESVSVSTLPDDARAALDRGDFSDSALATSLDAVARAMADRGA